MDQENQDLETKVRRLLYALLFLGVPHYADGLILEGTNVGGVPEIRAIGDLNAYNADHGESALVMSHSHCRQAHDVYGTFKMIWSKEGQFRRLRRGILAFLKGLAEGGAYDRIHQWCRSVEALILPPKGDTTRQFARRCQAFATGKGVGALLKEIYDLRCRVEHLHEFDDVYPDISRDDRHELLGLRARQAEAMARHAYQRVLLDPALTSLYKDELSIEALWKKNSQELWQAWGNPIDLISMS
jgi:hypothetical protein